MEDVDVGRRIAAARKRAGLAQRKTVTDRAGIPRFGPATLGKIERGQRTLGPHEAPLLARALGVPVSYFYEDDDETTQLDRIELKLEDNRRLLLALAIEAGVIGRSGGEWVQDEVREWMQARGFQDPAEAQPATSKRRIATGS